MNRYTVLVSTGHDTWEVRYIWADLYNQDKDGALVFLEQKEKTHAHWKEELYRIAPGQWKDVMSPDCKVGNLERTESGSAPEEI